MWDNGGKIGCLQWVSNKIIIDLHYDLASHYDWDVMGVYSNDDPRIDEHRFEAIIH